MFQATTLLWRRVMMVFSFVVTAAITTKAYDVPLEKVDPPQMNPRPRLPDITHRVYFEIEIDGEPRTGQQIVFGLFGSALPKTVENFVGLASCDRGTSKVNGNKPLCYKGSPFHRIVPSFGLSGGDFIFQDGTGSESIYGAPFEDESFEVRHNRKGLISMANHGKNTNGSQFFIQTNKAQWLDGKYVAFGVVLEGQDLIDEIEYFGQLGGTPTANVVIRDCGVMPLQPADKKIHYVSEWD